AFDLPTQIGHDADTPIARGGVGKVGVSISSLKDMETLLAGIPLDQVSTSMTISAPSAILLLLYELVAEQQGVAGSRLNGTVQNDILKEYAARGTYVFPPRSSTRRTRRGSRSRTSRRASPSSAPSSRTSSWRWRSSGRPAGSGRA